MELGKDLVAASATPLVRRLARGDSYGSAIINGSASCPGQLKWTDGMLIGAAPPQRLGHIAARWEVSESGRRRKYYRITRQGRAQLVEPATASGSWSMATLAHLRVRPRDGVRIAPALSGQTRAMVASASGTRSRGDRPMEGPMLAPPPLHAPRRDELEGICAIRRGARSVGLAADEASSGHQAHREPRRLSREFARETFRAAVKQLVWSGRNQRAGALPDLCRSPGGRRALAIKIPELFGCTPGSWPAVYTRTSVWFVLPLLTAYSRGKRRADGRVLAAGMLLAAARRLATSSVRPGVTPNLTGLHFRRSVVAVGSATWRALAHEQRAHGLRPFSAEMFIYYVLIALGGVLTFFIGRCSLLIGFWMSVGGGSSGTAVRSDGGAGGGCLAG